MLVRLKCGSNILDKLRNNHEHYSDTGIWITYHFCQITLSGMILSTGKEPAILLFCCNETNGPSQRGTRSLHYHLGIKIKTPLQPFLKPLLIPDNLNSSGHAPLWPSFYSWLFAAKMFSHLLDVHLSKFVKKLIIRQEKTKYDRNKVKI